MDNETINMKDLIKSVSKQELDKITHTKFNSKQWGQIEINFEGIQMKIANMMKEYGQKDKTNYSSIDFKICGEKNYNLLLRPYILKYFKGLPTNEKSKSKSKVKTKTKAQDIIETNLCSKITKELEIIETDKSIIDIRYGLTNDYLEIRLLSLMFEIREMFINRSKLEIERYELVVGIRKILQAIKKFNEKQKEDKLEVISFQCINDLEYLHDKLSKFINYSPMITCEKYPRLIISTKYDKVISFTSLKPYRSQTELIDLVYENVTKDKINPTLVLLRAMIGSGKTTTSVSIASLVEQIKRSNIDIELLFCCSVEPVRHQVGAFHYNTEIPFGIATMNKTTPIVTNHFSCGKVHSSRKIKVRNKALRESVKKAADKKRVTTIADLTSTLALLNVAKTTGKKYILFIDEPTVGADQENSPITSLVAEILNIAPEFTILASATMPDKSELKGIIEHFQSVYLTAQIKEIVSMETMIGNQIIDQYGNIIAPHTNCTNKETLKHICKRIENEPFVSRLYTAPILKILYNELKNKNIKNLPNLDERFNNIKNLNQQSIQKTVLELLNILKTQSNETIKKVCSLTLNKESNEKQYFTKENIFTTDAYKFTGGCLYAVSSPLELAKTLADEYFLNICMDTIMKNYELKLNIYNKKMEELKKHKISETKKSNNELFEHTTINDQIKELEESKPYIDFPSYLQINTHEHFKMFYKEDFEKDLDSSLIRTPLSPSNIPDFYVWDWIKLLLWCGVGIYNPSSEYLTKEYNDYVLYLASTGKLAFLIADDTISYGANYPFTHVIIEDKMAKTHSIGSIMQLLGRAGRVGCSWSAFGYVSESTKTRLIEFIQGTKTNGATLEAQNLIKALNKSKKRLSNLDNKIKEEKEFAKEYSERKTKLEKLEEFSNYLFLEKQKKEQEILYEKSKQEDIVKNNWRTVSYQDSNKKKLVNKWDSLTFNNKWKNNDQTNDQTNQTSKWR
jgi:hypothetical protein